MSGRWIGLLLAGVVLNAFVLLVFSEAYTAWSVRMRNEVAFFLLRRPVFRERADEADEIAERTVRWLRPLGLTLANAFWLYLMVVTLRKT